MQVAIVFLHHFDALSIHFNALSLPWTQHMLLLQALLVVCPPLVSPLVFFVNIMTSKTVSSLLIEHTIE